MVYFLEPLATEQLWHWLEAKQGWHVDSEVDTGNGRIDLACETQDGRYVGIELKAGSGLSWGAELSEQLWRYVDSGHFDAVYFASPSIDEISNRLDGESAEPLIAVVSRASRKLRAGVQEGRYAADEVMRRIQKEVDDSLLSYEFSGGRWTVREYIRRRVEERTERSLDPIPLDEGIRDISRSVLPEDIGLIEVPLPMQGGYLRSPRMALTPGEINEPKIVREPTTLTRVHEPRFEQEEEPWIRHYVWEKFGGLPEGSIPNVMESERIERPLDLVSFEESWDPTEVLETGSGEVIGVEAKGRSSFSTARVVSQLTECLETTSFSRLYLAVPEEIQKRASSLITQHEELAPVGILVIDGDGDMTTVREAQPLEIEHDGFKHGSELHKTGYGGIRIPNGRDVTSPFVLSEWREPLRDDAGKEVVWDHDPTEVNDLIHDVEELALSDPHELRDSLKEQARNASKSRAYLLTGYSAAPYVNGPEHGRREPKYGYVRMTVRDFETADGAYALELHFGAGGWEGGYICFVGDQVDGLFSMLCSLEYVPQGRIPGQGQYIDLKTFRWEYGENYEFKLGAEENSEKLLDLDIEATETEGGLGAILRLGEELQQGVEVTMTETQRIDFLRTLRIMRFGRPSELPGDSGGYQRVGPDGNDTWDSGTGVEKKHNPEELLKQQPADQSSKLSESNSIGQSDDSLTRAEGIQRESSTILDRLRSWIQ